MSAWYFIYFIYFFMVCQFTQFTFIHVLFVENSNFRGKSSQRYDILDIIFQLKRDDHISTNSYFFKVSKGTNAQWS